MNRLFQIGLLLILCLVPGCRREGDSSALGSKTQQRIFSVRGWLQDLPTDGRSAVIRHEAIPGYMAAMTMTFSVKEAGDLRGLTPGDEVEFRLIVTEDDQWIEKLRRTGYRPLQPKGNARLTNPRAELHPGDLLPDQPFLSEQGLTNRFSDFRGRSVALTFIFTRCPMPAFCPLMSKNFARARKELLERSGAPTNWQFLSLSFDPDHDTPEILSRYANSYRAGNDDRWLFGVLPSVVLAELQRQLNLIIDKEGGSLSHNLRTVVLDLRGHIWRQFDGNEWTPGELADSIAEAAVNNQTP
jgi:protein SCO1